MNINISFKICSKSRFHFVAKQTCFVSIVNCLLNAINPFVIFTTNINICSGYSHCFCSDDNSFDKLMRIEFHNLPIFERTGLTFIAIYAKIFVFIIVFWHETPLQASRKTSTTTTFQTRCFNYFNNFIRLHFECSLCLLVSAVCFINFKLLKVFNFRQQQFGSIIIYCVIKHIKSKI